MSSENDKHQEATNYREWLANVDELLSETDHLTPEEVNEALKAEGIDPSELIKRGLDFVERQRRLATYRMLSEAKQQKKDMMANIPDLQPQSGTVEELRTKVRDLLAAMTAQGIGQMAVAYRNLDALTEQDLRTLLADIERLQRLSSKSQNGNP